MCTALHKRNINSADASKWNKFTVVKIANYFKNELKDYYLVRRHAAFHKDFGKKTVKGKTLNSSLSDRHKWKHMKSIICKYSN